jgi:hypothetical protein
MEFKNKVLQNSIASIFAGLLWIVIIGALPFMEEILYPAQGTNDSWQRGLVLLPFALVIAVPCVYFISTLVVSRGWTKLSFFILATSLIATLIGSLIVIPSAVVMAYIGMVSIIESFQIILYSLTVILFTVIAPATLWWFLGSKSIY